MNKTKRTKNQLLMKSIALAIVCVLISQLFPSIVFGIQQSNELQDNENIVAEEKVEEEIKQEGTEEKTEQEEIEQEKPEEKTEKEETKQEETEEKTEQEEIKQEEMEEKIEQEANNRTGLQVQATKEIEEKRTLNEKHFLQKDGSIVASVYPMNVHYNSNGKLEDINNSLEEVWRRI